MNKIVVALLSVFIFCSAVNAQNDSTKNRKICVSANEYKLFELITQYRKENGLPYIPLSASLCYVAQTHTKDLLINKPNGSTCNLHSWSNNGKWSACCYTPDHKQATCMWSKPRELTNYKDYGYEIAFNTWHSDDANYEASAEEALKGWQQSVGHNEVIMNKGIWKNERWKAIGIGIYKGYAVVWFGATADDADVPTRCN
jgi:uncharacterized protein YkwD